jgi:hypothetical protein
MLLTILGKQHFTMTHALKLRLELKVLCLSTNWPNPAFYKVAFQPIPEILQNFDFRTCQNLQ